MITFTPDSQTIYCLVTGKPIAFITDGEYHIILDSLSHLDPETLNDELCIRTLCAMRPSTLWQSITPQSIESLRTRAPKELLAYLLNRMYATMPLKPSFEQRIEILRYRVNQWEILSHFDFDSEQLQQVLLILLELDSRFGLHQIPNAKGKVQIWTEYHSENIIELISHLAIWRDELVAKQEKELKRDRASEEFWAKGSRLTRKAFFQSFMSTKPPTRAAVKREAQKAEANLFDSILSTIFDDDEPAFSLQPSTPFVKPESKVVILDAAKRTNLKLSNTTVIKGAKAPLRFGVKS